MIRILALTTALALNLGLAGLHAENTPIHMTFSGTAGISAINLNYPGTSNTEENVAGSGTFGQFTFRDVRAASNTPQLSNSCNGEFFPSVAGGAVLRFQDGSLLNLTLIGGGDCINFTTQSASCTITYKVLNGTGRFQNATGTLTYFEIPGLVAFDPSGNPVFFSETGQITGTLSGISAGNSDH